MTSNPAENERIARRYPEEVATGRNVGLIDELLAEDFVEYGPFGDDTVGPAADKEKMTAFLEAFPDFEAVVEDAVAAGDMVALRVTLSGTHEGVFMGIEPTGRSFQVQNMVFTRIEDGKIAERWLQRNSRWSLRPQGATEA